jgi:hypothetical protein
MAGEIDRLRDVIAGIKATRSERPVANDTRAESEENLARLERAIRSVAAASPAHSADIACAPGDADGVKRAIEAIKASHRREWISQDLPACRAVARLEPGCLPTSTLTVSGYGAVEVRFTQCLAYFLDSRRPHGLEARLLQRWLGPFAQEVDLMSDWARDFVVHPEYCIGRAQPAGRVAAVFATS